VLEDWEDEPLPEDALAEGELDEELLAESTPSRWVGMANLVGSSLVAVVALQVALAVIEGLSYKTDEPQGVATGDLLHRLGYPFGSLGTTALLFLVVGVMLLSLPAYFEDETTEAQDRVAGVVLMVAAVVAVILTLGSILAVRANFHVYSESGRSVPSYVIVQYISFLIGSLGTAVVALYAAVQTRNLRAHR
jgi:cytochrome bd-type quinol oxidase subunit 2